MSKKLTKKITYNDPRELYLQISSLRAMEIISVIPETDNTVIVNYMVEHGSKNK